MNSTYLGGRVEGDVEVRELGDGKIVANFLMSTKRREKVDMHNIVAWNDAAKIAALLKHGDPLMIEGRLQTRTTSSQQRMVEVVAWTILPVKGRIEMEQASNG